MPDADAARPRRRTRFAVVGAGSIGLLYAGRLSRACPNGDVVLATRRREAVHQLTTGWDIVDHRGRVVSKDRSRGRRLGMRRPRHQSDHAKRASQEDRAHQARAEARAGFDRYVTIMWGCAPLLPCNRRTKHCVWIIHDPLLWALERHF